MDFVLWRISKSNFVIDLVHIDEQISRFGKKYSLYSYLIIYSGQAQMPLYGASHLLWIAVATYLGYLEKECKGNPRREATFTRYLLP